MRSGESGKPGYGLPEWISGVEHKGKTPKNDKKLTYNPLQGAPTVTFHTQIYIFYAQMNGLDQTNPRNPQTLQSVHWLSRYAQSSASCPKFEACDSKAPLPRNTFWSANRPRVNENAWFWSRWKRNCKIYDIQLFQPYQPTLRVVYMCSNLKVQKRGPPTL